MGDEGLIHGSPPSPYTLRTEELSCSECSNWRSPDYTQEFLTLLPLVLLGLLYTSFDTFCFPGLLLLSGRSK